MFLYMVALDDEKEGRYHIALQLTEMMGSNLETCTGDDSAFRKKPTNMSHMTIDERIIRLGKTSMRDKGCPLLIRAAQSTGWLSYLVFERFSDEIGIDDLKHVHSLTHMTSVNNVFGILENGLVPGERANRLTPAPRGHPAHVRSSRSNLPAKITFKEEHLHVWEIVRHRMRKHFDKGYHPSLGRSHSGHHAEGTSGYARATERR